MILIPGEPEPKTQGNSLLSAGMFKHDIESVLKNSLRLETLRKIHELRKSCGVEPVQGTVSVRIPFRYVKDC